MKKLFLLLLPVLMFFSTPSLYAYHDYDSSGYYGHRDRFLFCPGCNRYHYRSHPHFQQIYSTGDYYHPRATHYGAHKDRAGQHVRTENVTNPYQHGVRHGNRYRSNEGQHSGSYYRHE